MNPRDLAAFSEFFTGLDLVEPGVTIVSDWHSPLPVEQRPSAREIAIYGAVGRKP